MSGVPEGPVNTAGHYATSYPEVAAAVAAMCYSACLQQWRVARMKSGMPWCGYPRISSRLRCWRLAA